MPTNPSTDPPTNDRSVYLMVAGIVIPIFLGFVGILWKLDFFSFSGTDSSGKIVAAAIGLVGALFASLITFVGLLLRHSIDKRSLVLKEQAESRERLERERQAELKAQEEKRQKVDVAIRSIQLLSSPAGHEVTPSQRAGVILTLGELGMMNLALSLVDQMLASPDGTAPPKLDAGTACWLLHKALQDEDKDVQQQAAIITDQKVEHFLLPHGGAVFPSILIGPELVALPNDVRDEAVFALIDLLLLRRYADWNEGTFSRIVDALHYCWVRESEDLIRNNAGIALNTFLQVWDPETIVDWRHGSEKLSETLSELSQYAGLRLTGNVPSGSRSRARALAEWIKAEPEPPTNSGEPKPS